MVMFMAGGGAAHRSVNAPSALKARSVMRNSKPSVNSVGFTIVELMIAMSVLSVLLVGGAMVMTRIGELYTKGVNAASLQNSSRNVSSDLSSTLEFSGGKPFPCTSTALVCQVNTGDVANPNPRNFSGVTVYVNCVNNIRYSYVLNRELGHDSANNVDTFHVLWRDTISNSDQCFPLDISQDNNHPTDSYTASDSQGYEMVPEHVRLTKFKISESPTDSGIYAIDVWMAFGDSDLVVVDGATGSPACQGGAGTAFCAISKQSVSVSRRLE
jgi:prepilin-type N-terminal cleavage/methylation domain-containing protein